MATGVTSWSQNASSNATADANINWAEGQAPSTVNDSARALMASVAKFRDDVSGSVVTSGTSTAYVVSSYQGFPALTAGYMICIVPHATNGATVTINVDSLGAKPLRSAPGVELLAGVLAAGTPYVATYYTSNSGEWILHNFYNNYNANPFVIPVGGFLPYAGSTAPNSNFMLPAGQAISRTTYATLFALTSTIYGGGDGSTTFNLPDLRGRVPVGVDNLGGVTAGRVTSVSGITGTTLGSAGGESAHILTTSEAPTGLITLNDPQHQHAFTAAQVGSGALVSGGSGTAFGSASGNTSPASTGITLTDHGGNASHNNMQPSLISGYIIRVI